MSTKPKTDDQIAKDKEAIARMVGAKSAMEAALSRIETLEHALRDVDSIRSSVAKAVGDSLYMKIFRETAWTTISVRDILDNMAKIISKVQ